MSRVVEVEMMSETKTTQVGVRMRPNLRRALQELAETDRRSLSGYIELALEQHVEARRKASKGR
jgi:hypothetical protein